MDIFQKLKQNLKTNQTTIGIMMANDSDVIEALLEATRQKIARFILYGPQQEIESLIGDHYLNKSLIQIKDCQSLEMCCSQIANDIKNHQIQILMKGKVSTKEILQFVLNKKYQFILPNHLLSHVALLETNNYHKPLLISDGAININPTSQTMIKIVNNALTVMKILEYQKPQIALISAVEKISSRMPSTILAKEVMDQDQKVWIMPCDIFGPIALDGAISLHSNQVKNLKTTIGGKSDLLVMPNIESGNVLYKSLVFFAKAKTGGLVIGAKFPIILTSRSDSSKTKFNSIIFALFLISNQVKTNV